MTMRIACLILAPLAILFAVFQYNDPDPWIWIGLYGSAGVSLLMAGLGMPVRWLAWLTLAAALILAAMSAPGVWQFATNREGQTLANAMSKEYPFIEQTREFGGALIAMTMALIAACTGKPAARKVDRESAATG